MNIIFSMYSQRIANFQFPYALSIFPQVVVWMEIATIGTISASTSLSLNWAELGKNLIVSHGPNFRAGMPSKKNPVKFGTLAQKVGGGQASIPNFFYILIGTNNVGGRGLKGSCQKIIQ